MMNRLLAFLCCLTTLAWWLPNQAVNPPGSIAGQKFNSLSYAPFRPGESPLTETFATPAEVDEDLATLAPITRAIRTYASAEGSYNFAALAQKHGLKLWSGILLGSDRARNAREIARGIQLAHDYPDTIERVIVGNEVLLRRDLPVGELIADIDQVRRSVKQPVAYADVADFWDQFPEVAPHVDVVLVHLLPYWEDKPTGIDGAMDFIGRVYQHFVERFPNQKIAIGETGWPSRGRERAGAVPGLVNEARFLRGFMQLAAARHFDYNFVEAFDQDWKAADEGVVGGNWGIFTSARTLKIPPSGTLREDRFWWHHAIVSILCGFALVWYGLRGWQPGPGVASRPQLALLGMTLGAGLGFAQAELTPVIYTWHDRLVVLVNLLGQLLLAFLYVGRIAGALAPAPWRLAADAAQRMRVALRGRLMGPHGMFEDLSVLFLFAASVDQMLMVCDSRNRSFPLASFAVPLIVIVSRAARGDLPVGIGRRHEALLAATLTLGAIGSLGLEGLQNGQAVLWDVCALVLSVPAWVSLKRKRLLF